MHGACTCAPYYAHAQTHTNHYHKPDAIFHRFHSTPWTILITCTFSIPRSLFFYGGSTHAIIDHAISFSLSLLFIDFNILFVSWIGWFAKQVIRLPMRCDVASSFIWCWGRNMMSIAKSRWWWWCCCWCCWYIFFIEAHTKAATKAFVFVLLATATTSGGGGGQLVIAAVFAGEYWLVAISLMRMGFVWWIRFLAQGCNKLDQAHQIGKKNEKS